MCVEGRDGRGNQMEAKPAKPDLIRENLGRPGPVEHALCALKVETGPSGL